MLHPLTMKRLTLVVGGAGYGKTTLIANAIRRQELKAVWYTLDETDRDFSTFITYVLHGFKPYLTGADDILSGLNYASHLSAQQRLEALEKLIHQLEKTIKFELIFVLDDFHLIQDQPDICESIEFMLKHLPAFIHLTIISRAEPAIRISRLRVMNEVSDVHESDMTFTLGEIEGFYSEVFNLRLNPSSLKQIQTKTKGWVASLVLFFFVLRDRAHEEIENELDGITGSHKLIFTYLEENVFESQPLRVKQFMMRTAPLEKLDPDFCDTYLEIQNSRDLLEQLTANHLLTFKNESGTVYTYHHLLKEFLLTKLLSVTDRNGVSDLYLKIARLLERQGDDIAAIKHYLDGRHFLLAAQRLSAAEEKLFHAGQINRIRDFLSRFPQTMIVSVPGLIFLCAKIRSFSGDPLGAIPLFDSALKGFRQENAAQRVVDCKIQLGLHYYYTGHIQLAEEYLENCLKTGSGMKTLEIASLLIMIPAILGNIAKADTYASMARERIAGLKAPVKRQMETWITFCLSYRLFCSGDFQQAYDLGVDAFRQFQRGHTKIIMPLACLHVALPAYFIDQPETGLDYAKKGLDRLEQMDIHDNQLGWLNYAIALNLSGLNRLDDALAHARKSLDLFSRQSCYWGQATVYDLRHFIHRKMGDPDAAQRDLEKGFSILENTDLPFTRAMLEIGRLSMLIDNKQLDGVRQRLASAKDIVSSSSFYTFKIHVLASKLEWYQGHPSRARGHLRNALDLAGKHGYERQLVDGNDWLGPLLKALDIDEIDQPCLQRIFNIQNKLHRDFSTNHQPTQTSKAASAAVEIAGRRVASEISIYLLGHFKINVGDHDRPVEGLKNSKALMMIKYLAAMHHHGFIHRDEIIELLWPEQDFNKTRKRFNVAVSAIRKFFEPHITRGRPSLYLKKQGVSFKLDPGDNGRIDVHDFMDQIRQGDRSNDPGQAIHHYLAAQALYGGPFLVEDPYTQWCCDERRNLQHKYLSVLWKIICHFGHEKDYAKGIFFADQYLGIDDSAEHVYQKLMHFHSLAGNRSEIKKVFETCKRIVSDTLDCPLHPKTLDLYRSLLRHS